MLNARASKLLIAECSLETILLVKFNKLNTHEKKKSARILTSIMKCKLYY